MLGGDPSTPSGPQQHTPSLYRWGNLGERSEATGHRLSWATTATARGDVQAPVPSRSCAHGAKAELILQVANGNRHQHRAAAASHLHLTKPPVMGAAMVAQVPALHCLPSRRAPLEGRWQPRWAARGAGPCFCHPASSLAVQDILGGGHDSRRAHHTAGPNPFPAQCGAAQVTQAGRHATPWYTAPQAPREPQDHVVTGTWLRAWHQPDPTGREPQWLFII